ncbi:hypothetical protein BOTCAL_0257g00040 [Botryotinia calthae]|uniref:Uncharacterized protein n=1 Tax=Botryotinia calthae TaxID=38488 RepID=A0A4Y8CWB1_9HELO|nr:hypothetical protein BOTCAL_0257g00040 [Botryotinia calthae]
MQIPTTQTGPVVNEKKNRSWFTGCCARNQPWFDAPKLARTILKHDEFMAKLSIGKMLPTKTSLLQTEFDSNMT